MRRVGRQYRRGIGETVSSEDKKFGVGQNPIEQERTIDIIKPTDKATTDRLLEMINQMYPTAAPHQQQALDFWRIQLAQGNMTDQVKYEFLQRFHMWLLGRGNEVDTSKTMWGRGNAAVHNPQVAAYIDQFAKKRLEYALLLSLLQNRVPETLNGYYLYFKYIVNGNLKLATAADGTSFYDLSHEDFLADFDMMVQEFEKGRPGYAEIIKPAMQRPANVKAFGGEGATPSDPYPAAWYSRTTHELDSKANDEKAVQSIANRYGINAPAQSGKGGAHGTPQPFGGSAVNQGGEYKVQSAAQERRDNTNDASNPSIAPFTDASGMPINESSGFYNKDISGDTFEVLGAGSTNLDTSEIESMTPVKAKSHIPPESPFIEGTPTARLTPSKDKGELSPRNDTPPTQPLELTEDEIRMEKWMTGARLIRDVSDQEQRVESTANVNPVVEGPLQTLVQQMSSLDMARSMDESLLNLSDDAKEKAFRNAQTIAKLEIKSLKNPKLLDKATSEVRDAVLAWRKHLADQNVSTSHVRQFFNIGKQRQRDAAGRFVKTPRNV